MSRAATVTENRSTTDPVEFLVQKLGLFILVGAVLSFGVGVVFVISMGG